MIVQKKQIESMKHASEDPAEPCVSAVRKETSFPPNPNETPALRLYQFGALKGAAKNKSRKNIASYIDDQQG